mmetsp:Transcript_11959/g.22898  ORF Transcript_11959/g.22898 Transcript_11959/m.22898 type:complete len:97 (-) Transcript_11959:751-1041(-)
MSDEAGLRALLAQRSDELNTLRIEFEEYQGKSQEDMSKALEAEMELELEMSSKRTTELETENDNMRTQLEALRVTLIVGRDEAKHERIRSFLDTRQ